MTTRLLPHPVIAATVLIMWLLLNQSVSPGHIALGSAVALIASWGLAALRPAPVNYRSGRAIPRLTATVVSDIIRSNIAVARIILFPRKRRSGFVEVPLELRNRNGLAILACIITATPGTIWVQFDDADGVLLIHVLDLVDAKTWIDTIKGRYETHLLEIFA